MSKYFVILSFLFLAAALYGEDALVAPQEPAVVESQTPSEIESEQPELPSIYPIPEGEIVYTGGRYQDQKFRYRLHIPEMEEGKTYPLILWLHGYGGERGDDNQAQLGHSHLLFSRGTEKKTYPFFVLFPQCPVDNPGWYNGRNKDDQMATVALAMVDQVCNEYPIDKDRIILFGISGGATCCWRMLAENPSRFAAVVPTAAGPCETSLMGSLPTDVPVWVFMHNGDAVIQPPRVRQAIKMMKERGVKVGVTEFIGTTHNSWEPAFLQVDVLDWMLLQQRDRFVWYPPAMPHWPQAKRSVAYAWFSCALLPGAILVGILLVRWDRKRTLRRLDRLTINSEQLERENGTES